MNIVEEIVRDGGYSIINDFLDHSPWVRPGELIRPRGGVIHWTANLDNGSTAQANRNYWNGLHDKYASAHTLSDSGEIVAALPYLPGEAELGYHVGATSYKTARFGAYPNRTLLGHEMCVNQDGAFREAYKRAVWVLAHWSNTYRWNPQKDIVRHYDMTGKRCPLPFLDEIWSDVYCTSLEFDEEQIKWMRDNLHIDGIQGDALFAKFINDVTELLAIMDEGGIELLQKLMEKFEALQGRVDELEKQNKLSEVPEWAKEAVCAAQKAELVDTDVPVSGSYDFYRLLTVLHRKGIL